MDQTGFIMSSISKVKVMAVSVGPKALDSWLVIMKVLFVEIHCLLSLDDSHSTFGLHRVWHSE